MTKNNKSKLPFPYVADPDEDATYITIASPRTRDGEPLFTPKETVLLFFASILVDDLVEEAWDETISLMHNAIEAGSMANIPHRYRLSDRLAGSAQSTWLGGGHQLHPIVESSDKVHDHLHSILELRMLMCAYQILNQPTISHLLKGTFNTSTERLQEMEQAGFKVDGLEASFAGMNTTDESLVWLEIALDYSHSEDMDCPYSKNRIQYINETGEKQSLTWVEENEDKMLLPASAAFEHGVSEAVITHFYNNEFGVLFLNNTKNCVLDDISLYSLAFRAENNTQVHIDHVTFSNVSVTNLDLCAGITLNNCDLTKINVEYLTQYPLSHYDDEKELAPGDIPVVFNSCSLKQISVTHSYKLNLHFIDSYISMMTLPRSPMSEKHTFEDTNVFDLEFEMPRKRGEYCKSNISLPRLPRGALDIHLINNRLGTDGWLYNHSIKMPIKSKTLPEDGPIVLYATNSIAPQSEDVPQGHWSQIILDKATLHGDTYRSATCDELILFTYYRKT